MKNTAWNNSPSLYKYRHVYLLHNGIHRILEPLSCVISRNYASKHRARSRVSWQVPKNNYKHTHVVNMSITENLRKTKKPNNLSPFHLRVNSPNMLCQQYLVTHRTYSYKDFNMQKAIHYCDFSWKKKYNMMKYNT